MCASSLVLLWSVGRTCMRKTHLRQRGIDLCVSVDWLVDTLFVISTKMSLDVDDEEPAEFVKLIRYVIFLQNTRAHHPRRTRMHARTRTLTISELPQATSKRTAMRLLRVSNTPIFLGFLKTKHTLGSMSTSGSHLGIHTIIGSFGGAHHEETF